MREDGEGVSRAIRLALEAERRDDAVEQVLDRPQGLVTVERLQVVFRIQPRHLADVSRERVGLRDGIAVDFEYRQRAEAQVLAPLAEFLERQAFVLELDAGCVQRNADRFTASTTPSSVSALWSSRKISTGTRLQAAFISPGGMSLPLTEPLSTHWLRVTVAHLGLPSLLPAMARFEAPIKEKVACTPGASAMYHSNRSTEA